MRFEDPAQLDPLGLGPQDRDLAHEMAAMTVAARAARFQAGRRVNGGAPSREERVWLHFKHQTRMAQAQADERADAWSDFFEDPEGRDPPDDFLNLATLGHRAAGLRARDAFESWHSGLHDNFEPAVLERFTNVLTSRDGWLLVPIDQALFRLDESTDEELRIDLHGFSVREATQLMTEAAEVCGTFGFMRLGVVHGTPDRYERSIKRMFWVYVKERRLPFLTRPAVGEWVSPAVSSVALVPSADRFVPGR